MMALGGFFLACFAAASTNAAFKPGPWYESLLKPFWTPPDWLFSSVWTVLYILLALAAWMVWRNTSGDALVLPLTAFAVQLMINALWAPVFFGAHRVGLGFVVMMLLLVSVLVTVGFFLEVHTIAGLMLVPCLIWVAFAAFLNFGIWMMNTGDAADRLH